MPALLQSVPKIQHMNDTEYRAVDGVSAIPDLSIFQVPVACDCRKACNRTAKSSSLKPYSGTSAHSAMSRLYALRLQVWKQSANYLEKQVSSSAQLATCPNQTGQVLA